MHISPFESLTTKLRAQPPGQSKLREQSLFLSEQAETLLVTNFMNKFILCKQIECAILN